MAFSNHSSSFVKFSKGLELKKYLLQGCPTFKCFKSLHARLLCLGLGQHTYLLNMILQSSFHFGHPTYAQLVFHYIEEPNIFLWNTMIRGFVAKDCFHNAIEFYGLMRQNNFLPNNFTFPFVLKACARISDFGMAMKVHALILKLGFELDVYVKTSLVCLYAKCGFLEDGQKLFNEMPLRNVVSWTAIISGYISEGRFQEAVNLFRQMLEMDLKPDSFTLVRVLSACSQLGDVNNGEWIHGYIQEMGMEKNVFVSTALLDVYAKCGSMEKARYVFDRMVDKDVISWSIMINGYSSNGLPKEALGLFFLMRNDHVNPDCFTMVGVLSACARLGALDLGCWASSLIDKNEFLSNPILGTTLIDMYAKCGCMAFAWSVFQGMKEIDLVVWNAMINGLGMAGHGGIAFGLFNQMQKLGIQPDGNTFIGLLCICSHTGLVEDGRRYFNSISQLYSLTPRIEHYGCMVDLLGRAGSLDEAHQLIKCMPMEANAVVWGALLGGCRIHRDINLAEHVLKQLIELEPRNAGNYVLLSNIYSTSGRWDAAAKLRLVMNEKHIRKTPGCSWIELNGSIHEFLVGGQSHPLFEKICLKLDELFKELKALGYVPKTGSVLFDVEEEEKEHSLGHHSEKLAIAFGLISLMPEAVIRVVKNLRTLELVHILMLPFPAELRKSLYCLFSQYGRILDVVALKTPKLRGQAWVVFSELTAASTAVRQMQSFPFYNKPMRIQYAKTKSDCVAKAEGSYDPRDKKKKKEDKAEKKRKGDETQHGASNGTDAQSNGMASQAMRQGKPGADEAAAPNNILFIQNLPHETQSRMLQMLFEQYPGFKEVRMIEAKPGIAFVEFGDDVQASIAMQALQGFKITPQNPMSITYAKK
ncbi:hypothetical protein ACLOJK_031387 [Asimina triloba]